MPRAWVGETVVCAATGPSLTAEDLALVRDRARVIVVNDAYTVAPWADVLYAADARWWNWHQGANAFHGVKYSLSPEARVYGVTILRKGRTQGLSLDAGTLNTGLNSGYQAINLAVLYGAARIVLLGYDMLRGPGRREHFFGSHPSGGPPNLARFLPQFQTLVTPLAQAGVEVVNCTRRTAIRCFPQRPLEAEFPALAMVS